MKSPKSERETANQQIGHVAVVVADYDEAIRWYCDRLDFVVVEDTPISEEKRWVLIAPASSSGTSLLLAKASNGRIRNAGWRS